MNTSFPYTCKKAYVSVQVLFGMTVRGTVIHPMVP